MAKTIYRVEGAASGEAPRASASAAGDPSGRPRPALPEGPDLAAAKARRRKLFWVLIGIVILTAAMIAAIAALDASESPAMGAGLSPMTTWTQVYAPVTSPEPVGASTTMGTAAEDLSTTT